jgi:hypothetical protein
MDEFLTLHEFVQSMRRQGPPPWARGEFGARGRDDRRGPPRGDFEGRERGERRPRGDRPPRPPRPDGPPAVEEAPPAAEADSST